jgi:hypothetical protein
MKVNYDFNNHCCNALNAQVLLLNSMSDCNCSCHISFSFVGTSTIGISQELLWCFFYNLIDVDALFHSHPQFNLLWLDIYFVESRSNSLENFP